MIWPHLLAESRCTAPEELGDSELICGYNMMPGLDDESQGEALPESVQIEIGRVRE